ncbi:MAG: lysostaphin resistance A-like protein [Isosphaeraceae bacterium]
MVELMCVQATVNALLIVLLPLVVRVTSGAWFRDLGLSLQGWRDQVAVGVVSVLFLMPFVYGAQFIAMSALGPFDEESRHPVEKMFKKQFSSEAAALALLTAVVMAPLFEELMFRGIFQRWLVDLMDRFRNRVRSRPAGLSDTIELAQLPGVSGAPDPPRPDDPDFQWDNEAPCEPIGSGGSDGTPGFPDRSISPGDDPAAGPGIPDSLEPANWSEDFMDERPGEGSMMDERPSGYWEFGDPVPLVPKSDMPSHVGAGTAIVVTSLVFASLHAGQWPAPIPIFILALGLGFVYHRTGSLLASVCMHAVFNGFSTVMLFFVLLLGVPPAAEKKVPPPAVEDNAPVEKVTSVVSGENPRPDRGER